MNTKKKICIGIIVILISVIIGCFVFSLKMSKNKKIANTNNTNSTNITEQIQEENEVKKELITDNNVVSENTIDTGFVAENNVTTENNIIKVKTEKTSNEETKTVASQTQSISSNNEKSSTETKKVETTQNTNSEETKVVQMQAQVTSQVPIQISEKTEEKTETVIKQDEPTKEETKIETKDEELYVRNDVMINQIKQIIESNASENMMMYGYEIVVDSSIKELTNQFTFTENRVKSAITNKFGTIRIYAEDYYKNGQLIMTECYII